MSFKKNEKTRSLPHNPQLICRTAVLLEHCAKSTDERLVYYAHIWTSGFDYTLQLVDSSVKPLVCHPLNFISGPYI